VNIFFQLNTSCISTHVTKGIRLIDVDVFGLEKDSI